MKVFAIVNQKIKSISLSELIDLHDKAFRISYEIRKESGSFSVWRKDPSGLDLLASFSCEKEATSFLAKAREAFFREDGEISWSTDETEIIEIARECGYL